MDVVLVDDKEGEGALLEREWGSKGVRVLQSRGLHEIEELLAGGEPWPGAPYEIAAIIVDLDLGKAGEDCAGGVIAGVAAAERAQGALVFRTEDVEDDRALGAVLAAELIGHPLALWGKKTEDAAQLLSFIDDVTARRRPFPTHYGASMVQAVSFLPAGRKNARFLGDYLYAGRRADVWARIGEGIDAEIAVTAAGYSKPDKFWEEPQVLAAILMHLRDNNQPLHLLGGRTLVQEQVEDEIDRHRIEDLDLAIASVRSNTNSSESSRAHAVRTLQRERGEYMARIQSNAPRPYQNRSFDQGGFLSAYGQLLGHPEVVRLFRAKNRTKRTVDS